MAFDDEDHKVLAPSPGGDMTLLLTIDLTNFVSEEKRWQHQIICGLSIVRNAVAHNDAFQIPWAQDCLATMVGSEMLSTNENLLACNQVSAAEKGIPHIAFTTKYGLSMDVSNSVCFNVD